MYAQPGHCMELPVVNVQLNIYTYSKVFMTSVIS